MDSRVLPARFIATVMVGTCLLTAGTSARASTAADDAINVGVHPVAVAVDSDPSYHNAYVANRDLGTLSVIHDNRVTQTLQLPRQPGQPRPKPVSVATDPELHIVYVADAATDTISIIQMGEGGGGFRHVISTPYRPSEVGVDAQTHEVFVTYDDSDTVSIVDGQELSSNIDVPSGAKHVAVDSQRNVAYVASGATVTVIQNRKTLSTFREDSDITALAVDSRTGRLYVAENNQIQYRDNSAPFTTAHTEHRLSTLAAPGKTRTGQSSGIRGLTVDPVTREVYATNPHADFIDVFSPDGSSAQIPVGHQPSAVGVDTLTHELYVANRNSDSVSIHTPNLQITGFGPDHLVGGETTTIIGTGFATIGHGHQIAGQIRVDGVLQNQQNLNILDDNHIVFTTRQHPAGPADITIQSGENTFTYFQGLNFQPITLRSLDTTQGIGGQVAVTIHGSGLTQVSQVDFGNQPAQVIQVDSHALIAYPHEHPPGPVDVTLESPNDGWTIAPSAFTFIAGTIDTSIRPTALRGGGTRITLSGTGLRSTLGIDLDGHKAKDISLHSDTDSRQTVQFTTPEDRNGNGWLVIHTFDGDITLPGFINLVR